MTRRRPAAGFARITTRALAMIEILKKPVARAITHTCSANVKATARANCTVPPRNNKARWLACSEKRGDGRFDRARVRPTGLMAIMVSVRCVYTSRRACTRAFVIPVRANKGTRACARAKCDLAIDRSENYRALNHRATLNCVAYILTRLSAISIIKSPGGRSRNRARYHRRDIAEDVLSETSTDRRLQNSSHRLSCIDASLVPDHYRAHR